MGHKHKIHHPKIEAKPKRIPDCAKANGKTYRVPHTPQIAGDSSGRNIVFRFDCVDLADGCPWSLASMSEADHRLVLEKLREFERSTLSEILSPAYTSFTCYPDFSACPNSEPIERLGAYYDNGMDCLARFRLDGVKRLYGFLVGHEFHLVWWDANHEIWPSHKRHT